MKKGVEKRFTERRSCQGKDTCKREWRGKVVEEKTREKMEEKVIRKQ